jgi:hypothetical protein
VDGSATAKFHLVLDGQATLTIDDPGALSSLDNMTAAVPPAAGRDSAVGTALMLLRSQPGEASLSKAFRRAFGHAPGEYRRQQLAAHGVRATAAAKPR